jgi:uncharacterized protein DUF4296
MMQLIPTRTKVLTFGILLLFAACHTDEVLPVDEGKLTDVLVEIHIAESTMEEEVAEKWDSLATVYYPFILKNYDMEREQFDTCLAILKRNPALMAQVYEKVIERLKKKKLELGDEPDKS